MLFLPEIPGRFPVGATTFVTPVRPARSVGSASILNSLSNTPEPALYLEEVAFTAYYPADTRVNGTQKIQHGLNWVLRPMKESLSGFAKFSTLPRWILWPVIYLFGTLIKIPVYPNAPLLRPAEFESDKTLELPIPEQWPLVIFSHGLGGSRTAYSQFCSRLAASGKVVLAMEHRDGTGHACTSRSWGSNGKSKPRSILYYKDSEIILDHMSKSDASPEFPLRTEQLEYRRQEIHVAYQIFSRFIDGDLSVELETIEDSNIGRGSWSTLGPSGKRTVRHDENVTLAGHSFGGCTVLSILSTKPPPQYQSIPVGNALILDPWLEPLPSPGPVPLIHAHDDNRLPRLLVMNSETFTLWKDHYSRLQDVVNMWEPQGQRIMTLVGSQHASFSDFPGLPVFRRRGAEILMDVISKLSIGFLDDQLEQALKTVKTRKMEIEIIGKKKDGRPKRKLVGSIGDIIVT
ncbi:platelet-activating factor acetylhydrolase [Collybia nuda]|uniref:1-alkyl-2-acetylglycerophosphocholine esterase n=1 Tax=Collybia nuda TaxID=64659 RepID=A0A9P5Y8T6_9AGAR|nr:platelet-activating factor acetylhydrolase [Collybia nuda]